MVQAPSPALIESLKQPVGQDLLEALHQIKNSIIGHEHRKEAAVKHGLIAPLVNITSSTSPDGRSSNSNGDTAVDTTPPYIQWHQARLQSTIILASLAAGGTAFVEPLLRARFLECLLNVVLHESSNDLLLASLKAIRNLCISSDNSDNVDTDSLIPDTEALQLKQLFDLVTSKLTDLHARQYDGILCDIFSASYEFQIGPLVALSETAFSFLLSRVTTLPASGSDRKGSAYRASLSIDSLFPAITVHLSLLSQHDLDTCLMHTNVLLDELSNKANHTHIRHEGDEPNRPERRGLPLPADTKSSGLRNNAAANQESAVVWLIDTARSTSGAVRFAALQLLATVHSILSSVEKLSPQDECLKASHEARCSLIALSAVPLCVKLIQECSGSVSGSTPLALRESKSIGAHACRVFALLIADDRSLQIAAEQAGAIKHVCPLLRQTFDNISQTKPFWIPHPVADRELPDTCKMGSSGVPVEIRHVMRRRSGALLVLAALADREDSHRKSIIESNILRYVVDSLKPFPTDSSATMTSNLVQGNTHGVILAACRAAQNLSRSVSLLRTSLIDAGLARPIFDLLRHREQRVQIAATDVCANLILEFSPMREQLTACGVIETLCEHALNGSPALQCSSLWALKHSVLQAPVDQAQRTVNLLGVDWIAATIKGRLHSIDQQQTERTNGGVTLQSVNAAGDRVDLLNPTSMDVDISSASASTENDGGEHNTAADDEDGQLQYDEASNTHYHNSSIRSTLTAADKTVVQSLSLDHSLSVGDQRLQAQREDVALQLQGLDFVRNLVTGKACAEMVSFMFEHFGQQRLFNLLTEKLSPTTLLSHSQRQQQSTSAGPVYYPTDIVHAAVHVANHIANGGALRKEQLIAQRSLLQAMLPHFLHPSSDVRLACVWVVHTLTWKEGEPDTGGRRRRAQDLMNLGVYKAVQSLERDADLNVRDKVKMVLRQFAEA